MQRRVVQYPILEQREVIRGIAQSADHPLKLARNVINSERRVQAGLLDHFPSFLATATNFPREQEPLLADALSKLANGVQKVRSA